MVSETTVKGNPKSVVALYARVSTKEQDASMQLKELREYTTQRGFRVFREYVDIGVSGTKESRPELDKLMNDAKKRRFDVVLVWRFDRFARSTKHLVDSLYEFRNLGINFISFNENIDTGSPLGEAMFTIIGAMAKLERDIIVERVKAGLRKAKEDGKILGRPIKILNLMEMEALKRQGISYHQIAVKYGVSTVTVWNKLSKVKT